MNTTETCYFIDAEGKANGPLPLNSLRAGVAAGRLADTTLVCLRPGGEVLPLATVLSHGTKAFSSAPPRPAKPTPENQPHRAKRAPEAAPLPAAPSRPRSGLKKARSVGPAIGLFGKLFVAIGILAAVSWGVRLVTDTAISMADTYFTFSVVGTCVISGLLLMAAEEALAILHRIAEQTDGPPPV